MDELLAEISELEQQADGLTAALGIAADYDERVSITNEQNIVANKLSEKRYELQQLQEKVQQREIDIEVKVNAEPVPFSVLGIDLNGMPVEFVELIEGVYRTTLRNCLNEHAIELEQVEEKLKECEAVGLERGQEIDKLISEKLETIQEKTVLSDKLYGSLNDLADALTKRDAAVNEKEEQFRVMDAEIQSRQAYINELKAKISDYEQAEEYRQRQEQPLAVTAEESTSLQAKADAVKKLFTRSENWGSVEKLYKPDGTFEVVPRAELAEWESVDVPEMDEEPTIEPPTFREEDTTVQEHTVHGEVDADAATVDGDGESFEQRTERRLALLEAQAFGEIKAVA